MTVPWSAPTLRSLSDLDISDRVQFPNLTEYASGSLVRRNDAGTLASLRPHVSPKILDDDNGRI